jgi:branched-chain amino acid transport system ATP-binding protein
VELLTVAGLHVYYREMAALRGVSLHVAEGEIVALLGSNGAGKTTMLRTISGLQRPRRGTVSFAGADITRARAYAIVAKGLGHVPEGRRIFAALSVEENLNLGGYLSRRDHTIVAERKQRVFDLFPRLAERRAQLGGLLSGGEQQMLAVGRALGRRPKLLLLDELSLGLAPLLVERLLPVVRAYARDSGCAVLLVEQHVQLATEIADRCYVLSHGDIVLHETGERLMRDPSLLVASYVGQREPDPGKAVAGSGA